MKIIIRRFNYAGAGMRAEWKYFLIILIVALWDALICNYYYNISVLREFALLWLQASLSPSCLATDICINTKFCCNSLNDKTLSRLTSPLTLQKYLGKCFSVRISFNSLILGTTIWARECLLGTSNEQSGWGKIKAFCVNAKQGKYASLESSKFQVTRGKMSWNSSTYKAQPGSFC
jgi:hypothetical protein